MGVHIAKRSGPGMRRQSDRPRWNTNWRLASKVGLWVLLSHSTATLKRCFVVYWWYLVLIPSPKLSIALSSSRSAGYVLSISRCPPWTRSFVHSPHCEAYVHKRHVAASRPPTGYNQRCFPLHPLGLLSRAGAPVPTSDPNGGHGSSISRAYSMGDSHMPHISQCVCPLRQSHMDGSILHA